LAAFFATFLAAFFFFFAMEMAPYHEHPKLTNDRSPGCSVEGTDDVLQRFTTRKCAVMGELWTMEIKTVKRIWEIF
jgi:hypothetical protein